MDDIIYEDKTRKINEYSMARTIIGAISKMRVKWYVENARDEMKHVKDIKI